MSKVTMKSFKDTLFKYFGIFCTLFGIIMLAVFIISILNEGLTRIDWAFLTGMPSRLPQRSGILSALAGTIWIVVLTAFLAIPIGISAAIFLEEYGKRNRFARLVEINIANLASIPSIIYGLLGLQIFSRLMGMGGSLLAGSATLALLVLPIVIVSTREAIKAVPSSLKDASYALGASRWQTVWNMTLPAATGSIMTGIILALSRAIGEAAPLIVVGALAYVPFVPSDPTSEFTVLPIQIFNWASRPQHGFMVNASAAIIVLLVITFLMNGVAVYLRYRRQKKVRW
ncbi:MAG: phosphate ABC transporter permease PstA [Bacteroidota bacterium]|nr:phosphate ABC transporter permease PstA [Bacteroidota bacterium]